MNEFDHILKYQIKEIKDFPGYYIDTDGVTWTTHSRGRYSQANSAIKRELRQTPDKHGYLCVTLKHKNGEYKCCRIHRLVLETFRGMPPIDGNGNPYDGCHGISGKQDNRLINLEWKTKRENYTIDKARDGQLLTGEQLSWSKINQKIANIIRHLLGFKTMTQQQIADIWDISRGAVKGIKDGRTWVRD